jgi:GT2 family glycosyltransferase
MQASVIVCTHNRESLISGCIEDLLVVDFPPREFEIVVVDNGSTDNTREQVLKLVRRNAGRVHYVHEGEIGLSAARNAGLRHARGEIIAMIDDDARPDPGWLKALVTAYDRKEVWCAGGKVFADYQGRWPGWLAPEMLSYLSLFDLGDRSLELTYSNYPRGVNTSFRRQAFERVGVFSTAFGRKGNSLISYEEVELCYRIEEAGGKILYVPDAVVHHLIPIKRLSKDWFLERFYWQGRSEARFDLIHKGLGFACRQLKHRRANPYPASRSPDGTDFHSRCARNGLAGYFSGIVRGVLAAEKFRFRPQKFRQGSMGSC